ncbi:MAG: type II CAAX prenyl endopeptidase Rce1 family protein [Spirochaetota bacterium]
MTKLLKQAGWVLCLAVILLGAPRLGGLVANQFDYSGIDPDGAFAWISVHHIVQAIIVLAIMIAFARIRGIQFGLGRGDRKIGFSFVRLFALIFVAYTAVSMVIVLVTGTFQTFPYPLTARNIAGQLAFQLLLSGPSEELIFRGFAITMLALALRGSILNGKVSVANIVAALVFGLAHVATAIGPFELTYSPFQVVYAVAVGVSAVATSIIG